MALGREDYNANKPMDLEKIEARIDDLQKTKASLALTRAINEPLSSKWLQPNTMRISGLIDYEAMYQKLKKEHGLCLHSLMEIASATDPHAPGVHDSVTLPNINWWAKQGLGIASMSVSEWLESQHKKTDSDPRDVNEFSLADKHGKCLSPLSMKTCAERALKKLSGDLSYDNVAAVKQLMKQIIDYT